MEAEKGGASASGAVNLSRVNDRLDGLHEEGAVVMCVGLWIPCARDVVVAPLFRR